MDPQTLAVMDVEIEQVVDVAQTVEYLLYGLPIPGTDLRLQVVPQRLQQHSGILPQLRAHRPAM